MGGRYDPNKNTCHTSSPHSLALSLSLSLCRCHCPCRSYSLLTCPLLCVCVCVCLLSVIRCCVCACACVRVCVCVSMWRRTVGCQHHTSAVQRYKLLFSAQCSTFSPAHNHSQHTHTHTHTHTHSHLLPPGDACNKIESSICYTHTKCYNCNFWGLLTFQGY